MLTLRPRNAGVLTGGKGDVWAAVDNEVALGVVPEGMAMLLRQLTVRPDYEINAGKMQIVIRYRGVNSAE